MQFSFSFYVSISFTLRQIPKDAISTDQLNLEAKVESKVHEIDSFSQSLKLFPCILDSKLALRYKKNSLTNH